MMQNNLRRISRCSCDSSLHTFLKHFLKFLLITSRCVTEMYFLRFSVYEGFSQLHVFINETTFRLIITILLAFTTHLRVFSLLSLEVSRSHTRTHLSDQSVVGTLPDKHSTLTTDKHPCPRWDSNPQSQQANGCRPTP
jgi:hypothetical protein